MKPENATKILESIQPELQKIEDPHIKHVVSVLLNLIEILASDNARLKQENQLLNDEINHLNLALPLAGVKVPPMLNSSKFS